MSNRFGLEGRVAVVTGALGNLGPVWTEGLLEAGAIVIGLDLPPAKPNAAFATLQSEYGDRYPDVIQRKTEIAALEAALGPSFTPRSGGTPAPPVTDPQIAALKAEEADLRQTIAMYE